MCLNPLQLYVLLKHVLCKFFCLQKTLVLPYYIHGDNRIPVYVLLVKAFFLSKVISVDYTTIKLMCNQQTNILYCTFLYMHYVCRPPEQITCLVVGAHKFNYNKVALKVQARGSKEIFQPLNKH